jgi:hypothetical protein
MKKNTSKKIVKKIKTKKVTKKSKVVTEAYLDLVLDKRFADNNQVILDAVSEMFSNQSKIFYSKFDELDEKIRMNNAYTELRTQEILDVLKDVK